MRALTFTFRDTTEVWLDDIVVAVGSPVLSPEAVAATTGGTVTRGHQAAIVSAVAGLDATTLAARLDAVADTVLAELPFLAAPNVPVPLVVFADEETYRAGVIQLGAAFAANVAAPASGGFTLEGIATSSWDTRWGIGRPVYVHEFVHAWISRTAGLPNGGEWLQEGLANRYQLQSHPQATLAAVVAGRLAHALPLTRLCDGGRIEGKHYADAWTVVGALLEHPGWAGTLPRVFEAAARTGTTSLPALGIDLAALDRDRRTWAAQHFSR